jgi:hypothetical protein
MDFRHLTLGDKVVFADAGPKPFNVRAVSPDHMVVILSRPSSDGSSAEYTMIDWTRPGRATDGTNGAGHMIGSGVHRNLHRFFHTMLGGSAGPPPPTQTVLDFGNWTDVAIVAVNGQP